MLKISVPATSANLGPGFDSIGLALDLHNDFYVLEQDEKEPGSSEILPGHSLFQRAVDLLAKTVKKELRELKVAMISGVPRARGLGSSATLTVGGLIAADVLLKTDLSIEEMLRLAAEIEGHPDNAAPALVGGLVVCLKTGGGIKHKKIIPPHPVQAVVAVPEFKLATSLARQVLPREVTHQDAVQNTGRFGFFMASMLTGDYSLLAPAMEDLLHQPYRLHLVPGLKEVMKIAVDTGALGSCLSGAGPSVLAFADKEVPQICAAMKTTWRKFGINAEVYVLNIAATGASFEWVPDQFS